MNGEWDFVVPSPLIYYSITSVTIISIITGIVIVAIIILGNIINYFPTLRIPTQSVPAYSSAPRIPPSLWECCLRFSKPVFYSRNKLYPIRSVVPFVLGFCT